MLSIKDYAKSKHITYEAVRQSVKRYELELEGHIFVQGKTRYLDDYAVKFLDNKRATNPVIIYEASKDEEIERLNREVSNLKDQVNSLQALLLQEKEKMLPLQQSLQLADIEKERAVHHAVQEANKLAEAAKEDALREKARVLAEQAEIEKNKAREEAARIAAEEKEKEYAPVLQEAQKELEREIGFFEWLKTRGKKKVGR